MTDMVIKKKFSITKKCSKEFLFMVYEFFFFYNQNLWHGTRYFRTVPFLDKRNHCLTCPKSLLKDNDHFIYRSVLTTLRHTKTHTDACACSLNYTHTHSQSICRQTSSSSLAAEDCCTSLLFPSSTSWQWNCGKSLGRLHKLGIAVKKNKYSSFLPNTLDSR